MSIIEKVSYTEEEKKFLMGPAAGRIDYNKDLFLSNEEFRQFYDELMAEYRDKDKW